MLPRRVRWFCHERDDRGNSGECFLPLGRVHCWARPGLGLVMVVKQPAPSSAAAADPRLSYSLLLSTIPHLKTKMLHGCYSVI